MKKDSVPKDSGELLDGGFISKLSELRGEIEGMRKENEQLRKTAIPNSKYMTVFKKLKVRLFALSSRLDALLLPFGLGDSLAASIS